MHKLKQALARPHSSSSLKDASSEHAADAASLDSSRSQIPPADPAQTGSVVTKAADHKQIDRERERHEKSALLREGIAQRHKEAYERDPLKTHYGEIEPLEVGEQNTSGAHTPRARFDTNRERFETISRSAIGTRVVVRARIHHVRPMSKKVAFVLLRQQLSTIQAVLVAREGKVSENMVTWTERLRPETPVLVEGVLQKPVSAKDEEVKSATYHKVEILVEKIHAVGSVTISLPFQIFDVEHPASEAPTPMSRPSDDTRSVENPDPDNMILKAVTRALTQEDARVHTTSSHVYDSGAATPSTPSSPIAERPASISLSHSQRSRHIGLHVGDDTRLRHRILDLRSNTSQAIFRVQAGVCRFFRNYLDEQGFTEIHTSKLQGGATESGASVFGVDYFGRAAFLAQSPQLGKQGAIAADFERVYEIGPVFRAENSNTHRHLTEFTGLDLEMAFEHDYHEVVDMLDGALLAIFKGLQKHYRREVDIIRQYFPSEDLIFPDKTIRIPFKEGVKMLNESGWTENGKAIPEDEDFSTPTERKLGELVKLKFGTDYYILDKFPLSARPFYTMPDHTDARFSNSCDFFIRGEEILSGGQRIHEAPMLEKRMREAGIATETMAEYLAGFQQGCPPHGGGGIGLERVVFLFLKLGNIRWATMYPRDPRSFPAPLVAGGVPGGSRSSLVPLNGAVTDKWRTHRGADTIDFALRCRKGENVSMPTLEDLIATYGDSPNTSWLDPFWTVWRDSATGAAIGYATHGHYAVAWGRPLCDDSQLDQVCRAFFAFLKSKKLKPIWACVDGATEHILLEKMHWSCVSAVDEQRVDPSHMSEEQEKALQQKVRRAEREGVKAYAIEMGKLDDTLKNEITTRMKDWQQHRKGTQVYSAGLRPFDDEEHRHYFIARDRDGTLCALVVLAQLAAEHGYQIKYSLDFPGCPVGTIEYIVMFALHAAGDAGVRSATFGGAAPEAIVPAGDHWGLRMKLLAKTYSTITKSFRLTDRGSFRRKFGAAADPQWVCFPKGGLGVHGVQALMKVLQSEK